MKKLKADLHIHTSEDPEDLIKYSAVQLIDMAADLGYQVLSITNHNAVTWNNYLRDYAKERGIILIPGIEATIEGRHVLIYNADFSQIDRNKVSSLASLKNSQSLIVAPHPFFPSTVALRGLFKKNIHLFDAVEFSHFYTKNINFNQKAKKIANQHDLPIIGTSDAHQRIQFHSTYSLIEAEFHPQAVIEAIKQHKVEVVTNPLSLSALTKILCTMGWRNEVVKRCQTLRGHSKGSFLTKKTFR